MSILFKNSSESQKTTVDLVGQNAAFLSAIEVGLGSLLHGLRVPFSGHFLSLNQAFILSRSTLRAKKLKNIRRVRQMPFAISNIAAVLKSLSPAGKKLGPMLAISAQGFLFSLGTMLFGTHYLGIFIGCILLSLWAFLQPVLVYFLIFGKTILDVGEYYYEKLQEVFTFDAKDLFLILSVVVSIKLLLSLFVAFAAFYLSDQTVEKYQTKMVASGQLKRKKLFSQPQTALSLSQKAILALKDLLNPLFLISFSLTAIFFIYSEAPVGNTIWILLRPLAIGFLIFFAVRILPFDRIFSWLDKTQFQGFSKAFKGAVQTLKEI